MPGSLPSRKTAMQSTLTATTGLEHPLAVDRMHPTPAMDTLLAQDEALVLAAQSGDGAAFDKLHERYARLIHGIALVYLSHTDAPDLVQDVFLAAFQKIRELKSARAFGPWLASIARRRAVDLLRTRKTTVELPDHLPVRDRRTDEALAVLAALRELPQCYSEPLILRLVEGMTGPEIAAQIGMTPDSVRVNLHRGMKLLRKRLEGGEACKNETTK